MSKKKASRKKEKRSHTVKKKHKQNNYKQLAAIAGWVICHIGDWFIIGPIKEAINNTSIFQSTVKSFEILISVIEQLLHEPFS